MLHVIIDPDGISLLPRHPWEGRVRKASFYEEIRDVKALMEVINGAGCEWIIRPKCQYVKTYKYTPVMAEADLAYGKVRQDERDKYKRNF